MDVTSFKRGFVLHLGDAMMKRLPTGFLCNFGVQYRDGKQSIPSSNKSPRSFKEDLCESTISLDVKFIGS